MQSPLLPVLMTDATGRNRQQASVMSRLRDKLAFLGYAVEGATDTELLMFASRELDGPVQRKRQQLERAAQESYRLKHLALPSSAEDPWGLGATLEVWRLTRTAPFWEYTGRAVITERTVEDGEVTRLGACTRSSGFTDLKVTRKPGSPYAWEGVSRFGGTMVRPPAGGVWSADLPKVPRRLGPLKVYYWNREHGRGEHIMYVVAAYSQRDVNVILGRSGKNEFPHVQESDREEHQFARAAPLTLYSFRSGRNQFDWPHTFDKDKDADMYRTWLNLRHDYGG